jgi:cytochrome c biogenesis protein CcdA
MLHLLGLVIPIGLADGINLTSIGPALYLASQPHPRRKIMRFTYGYAAVMLLGGLILTLGPGRAILALVPKPSLTTRYILETLAGAVILIVGAVLWCRREDLASHERATDSHAHRRSPFRLGATISAVELPTAFPYFAAIAATVGSGLSVVDQVIAVVVYNVCFVLPLLGIIGTLTYAGDRAMDVLTRIRDFLHKRWPVVAAVIALVAGAFVLALGITGLVQSVGGSAGRISRGLRNLLTNPTG